MTEVITDQTPFVDLPAALVEEMLAETREVAQSLLEAFRATKTERSRFRSDLAASGLMLNESAFGYPPLPTTCGVDGSYAIELLLASDLAACAAVAVEGLTPPSAASRQVV